jgi:hypothetical protein
MAPLNLIHNLMPNVPLKNAVQETLSRAFPKASINMLISSALKLAYQDAGMYQSMPQYAKYVNKLSQSILGPNKYLGINFSANSNKLNVWDGTQPVSTGDISYLDLIGQPTWIDMFQVNIKVVLRAGLQIGSHLTLPPTLMTTGAGSFAPNVPEQKKNLAFSGDFIVTRVLHIGDFRNPDGSSWCTNYEATFQGATTGANPVTSAVDSSQGQPNITVKTIGGTVSR